VTYENGRKLRLPALLLPMTEGRDLRALLRIFLDPDGQKARCLDGAKRTLGDTRGSVIQLPPDATMNLAEGFEDAESAMVLNDLPGCAAVCGVERYREITIPTMCAGSSSTPAWQGRGRWDRARARQSHRKRSLARHRASSAGGDWNDALMARMAISAESASAFGRRRGRFSRPRSPLGGSHHQDGSMACFGLAPPSACTPLPSSIRSCAIRNGQSWVRLILNQPRE
jgi:hypothetical protein